MSRILMILFPEKESDTKHICYEGGCSLFTKEQGGLCHQLWSTPPHHINGKMASMCNFYDTMNPTIVEANNMDVREAIARVQEKKYISKDALLKWAKEKYNKAYKLHLKKGANYAYGQGKMNAYQKLIDKLNSM